MVHFVTCRREPIPRLPSDAVSPGAASPALSLPPPWVAAFSTSVIGWVVNRIGFHVLVQFRVVAAQPLQHHHGVLFLLVAVVLHDGAQLGIVRGLGALVVPIDSLELLHQRDDGAVMIDDLGTELPGILV